MATEPSVPFPFSLCVHYSLDLCHSNERTSSYLSAGAQKCPCRATFLLRYDYENQGHSSELTSRAPFQHYHRSTDEELHCLTPTGTNFTDQMPLLPQTDHPIVLYSS